MLSAFQICYLMMALLPDGDFIWRGVRACVYVCTCARVRVLTHAPPTLLSKEAVPEKAVCQARLLASLKNRGVSASEFLRHLN